MKNLENVFKVHKILLRFLQILAKIPLQFHLNFLCILLNFLHNFIEIFFLISRVFPTFFLKFVKNFLKSYQFLLKFIQIFLNVSLQFCSYLTNTVHVGAFAECQFWLASWLVLAGCMPTAPILFESFLDTIVSLSTTVYACKF